MRILLLTPPMTQLNTPYPATVYLTGFLRNRGVDARQADPSIELVLRLFSRVGLGQIRDQLQEQASRASIPGVIRFFLAHSERYVATVEPVIRFLQGKDPSLALRIVSREFLPEGPRFRAVQQGEELGEEQGLAWAFGSLGVQDQAKYLASLYLDDLADVIREGVDPRFELSRYGEKLAASAPSFDPLEEALLSEPTIVDRYLEDVTAELIEKHNPEVVAVTAPFPGNVYGAFRIAQKIKRMSPHAVTVLGGGYVNTELRSLTEPRVFDYFDYICLDDGERPLLCLIEHLQNRRPRERLHRTYLRRDGRVVLVNDSGEHDIPHRETGTPTYDGLKLDSYLSVFEMLNPMHRIWSDGRWNKLTLAHGCYWKKCNFCDVTLDYIGRYDAAAADLIVDRIEALIRETGQSGFHFVDEAAPPAVLRAMAERLLARGISITWWGNIRFEKTFTPELTQLLARSGCVAVSGGLEVASDRLLAMMNKGVSVEQVARVTRAFTEAGIMVHAYLMYGFPTQTLQETVDSLERVRQMFEAGCIQSAYWHRFSATVHSPIGKDPGKFGIRLLSQLQTPAQPQSQSLPGAQAHGATFAQNDLPFEDPTGVDHDRLGTGLRKAHYNYMHGVGLDTDVRFWFEGTGPRVPKARVPAGWVASALHQQSARSVLR